MRYHAALGHRELKLTILQCWSASFNQRSSWKAHEGIVLSSIVTRLRDPRVGEVAVRELNGDRAKGSDRFILVTGGNDDQIKVNKICSLAAC